MADKVRGALKQIDWSTSNNQVSINTKKAAQPRRQSHEQKSASGAHSHNKAYVTPVARSGDDGEVPVNQYRSVIAPVKSGREEKAVHRQVADDEQRQDRRSRPYQDHTREGGREEEEDEDDEEVQVYLGYLGSIKVPSDKVSTGILAIQAPMRELYFPYRQDKVFAQERIVSLSSSGLEVFYMADPQADEPSSYTIAWQDMLYIEPLRFSTKKATKDRKGVLAAFEPCEAQRLTMLGNRDSLYAPLSNQHKHISLLKHPALLCMVVSNPQTQSGMYTHGFICSTLEESVFLARKIRDELELQYRESRRAGHHSTPSSMSIVDSRYKLEKQPIPARRHSKSKSKRKSSSKRERETNTTHTGHDTDDYGSFHFGMSTAPSSGGRPGDLLVAHTLRRHNYADDEEIQNSINENFLIGRPGADAESRQQIRHSVFSELDDELHYPSHVGSARGSDGRPVGVVQPQVSAMRDGFKVLPTDVLRDRTQLKPTALNIRGKRQSEITPELDLKLRMRQQEKSEPVLSPLAPRSVINPLADVGPELHRRSYISAMPGPISKMSTSLQFNPSAALPHSSWHESVIGNFKSKEKIEKRLTTETVDAKEMPKLKSDKKAMEMANLFTDLDMNSLADGHQEESGEGTISQLHEAMGFMP